MMTVLPFVSLAIFSVQPALINQIIAHHVIQQLEDIWLIIAVNAKMDTSMMQAGSVNHVIDLALLAIKLPRLAAHVQLTRL